ncbi:type 2 isopentenyl-diphosphate Delta-isomerase [Alloscardovia macacae]|uniref:Isopentenyl-diphosphate delta-isomerase n=1 Tax=Alloscardovia macacae TaxID=1160091 RepID=A0A1Y2SV41_9BIFI|nr:type 2 isopentenyl-diphosphate Delta-isomerase [Alloscardovia macacae]OTA26797.1 type 2 isopentenyl-diphosphate Delta-isomerase [Alloscardovia macacae]OTA29178.1 type 2 isopentenyl-diphosphate Delta-isomerase [Alloscardovia macacae]
MYDSHISSRKDDHVRLAQQYYEQNALNPRTHAEIDAMQFIPNALPEVSRADVSRETSFAGLALERPYFINAMTGGTPRANEINRRLARVAQETHSPMALGSMSIAVKNPDTRAAYAQLAADFPDVNFLANLGAEHTLDSARLVVDLVGAKALQIHLNAAQEIVMPEGEKDFRGWTEHIRAVAEGLGADGVPVIVKEVGFGMSAETVAQLVDAGVRTVDVAGRGGTNFVQIENARNAEQDFSYLEDWGLSTLRSLLEAVHVREEREEHLDIIASGGVRGPLDIVKYVALGADAVGLSAAFLQAVTASEDADEAVAGAVALVRAWDEHVTNLLTILGVRSLPQLRARAPYVLPESVHAYVRQRFV